MKFSKYNSLLGLTSQSSIIYNSKEDKCIIFKKEDESLLCLLPEEVKNKNHRLFNQLREINAIVDSNINELEEVIQLSKEIINDESIFKLIIIPTMDCNFSCWYCYESHITGSKLSTKTIDSIYKLIDNILVSNSNLRNFTLSFFGGEPLLYYNETTKLIIDYIRTKYVYFTYIDFSINFTTNGYLLNDKIVKHLLEKDELKHFQITLDGGRNKHNGVRYTIEKEGSYDRIIQSIKILIKNRIEVLLRVNYTAKNIVSTKDIFTDIGDISLEDKKYLKIGYFRIWQEKKKMNIENIVDRIITKYQDNNFRVSNDNEILDELKNPCYADKKNELVVNFNGDLYKCTARDFNKKNKLGKLNEKGNVVWLKDKLEEWGNIKIQSKMCKCCRILPLCGGGCHQINIETKGMDLCQMGYSESDKNRIILNRLSALFVNEEV
jgi:uncharacterized protein